MMRAVVAALFALLSAWAPSQDTRLDTAGSLPPAPVAIPAIRLSLQDATALAVRNNLSLRVAHIDEQIAEARVRQRLAVFDPTLYASLNAGKQEQLFAGLFPVPGDPTTSVAVVVNTREDVADGALGLRGTLSTGGT